MNEVKATVMQKWEVEEDTLWNGYALYPYQDLFVGDY